MKRRRKVRQIINAITRRVSQEHAGHNCARYLVPGTRECLPCLLESMRFGLAMLAFWRITQQEYPALTSEENELIALVGREGYDRLSEKQISDYQEIVKVTCPHCNGIAIVPIAPRRKLAAIATEIQTPGSRNNAYCHRCGRHIFVPKEIVFEFFRKATLKKANVPFGEVATYE